MTAIARWTDPSEPFHPAISRLERTDQRRARRHARRAFDASMLEHFCTADDFTDYGRLEVIGDKWNDFYIFQDNDAPILAVAHLDTVMGRRKFRMSNTGHGPIVHSPTLDDRLGAYVIADLLPKLGVHADILFTTGEETGNSTAQFFDTDRQYNWMFSFDRTGTDVVMYDYDNAARRAMLRAVGAPVGVGSFSDIDFLQHLGCAGFNWGVGYRDYHSNSAYAPLNDTFLSVGRFLRFYEKHRDTFMPHEERDRWKRWERSDEEALNGQPFGGRPTHCPACLVELTEHWFCEECGWDWLKDDKEFHQEMEEQQELDVQAKVYGLTEAEWVKLQQQIGEALDN